MQWARLGAPLRPSADDVAIMGAIGVHARRVLLLGVTPELASMPWPAGASLVAADRSYAMIRAILPAVTLPMQAIVADWRALPCARAAFDLAIGDGCLSNFTYPDGYRALATELHRVIAPGGLLALRLFASPAQGESLDDVARDLRAGAIGGMHALKWRIAMTLLDATRNVAVTAIRDAFDALVPDRAVLPWPREVVDTIDAYRGSALVYSFPSLDHVRDVMSERFEEVAVTTPDYELGERCPTVTWRR